MAVRFPGPAVAPTAPLRWEAWTQPREAVRFPGEATPGSTPLRWAAWTREPAPRPRPIRTRPPAPTPPAVRPAVDRTPAPTPAAVALHPQLGVHPLMQALAASHAGVADAHAMYLEQQRLNLERLAALHERLVNIALR